MYNFLKNLLSNVLNTLLAKSKQQKLCLLWEIGEFWSGDDGVADSWMFSSHSRWIRGTVWRETRRMDCNLWPCAKVLQNQFGFTFAFIFGLFCQFGTHNFNILQVHLLIIFSYQFITFTWILYLSWLCCVVLYEISLMWNLFLVEIFSVWCMVLIVNKLLVQHTTTLRKNEFFFINHNDALIMTCVL